MYLAEQAFRHVVGVIVAALVVVVAAASIANAQQSQIPNVAAFLANPQGLLQQNQNGGSRLSNEVQQLALADPSTFKMLLGLLKDANDPQRGAIGEGLAQAAKIEVLTDQTIAADWQQQIAAIDNPAFKTAATNAFGDVKLGAIGGGPLGGDGGGPAGPSGSPGPLQDFSSNAVPTHPFTITSTTVGSAAPPSSPVSP